MFNYQSIVHGMTGMIYTSNLVINLDIWMAVHTHKNYKLN